MKELINSLKKHRKTGKLGDPDYIIFEGEANAQSDPSLNIKFSYDQTYNPYKSRHWYFGTSKTVISRITDHIKKHFDKFHVSIIHKKDIFLVVIDLKFQDSKEIGCKSVPFCKKIT